MKSHPFKRDQIMENTTVNQFDQTKPTRKPNDVTLNNVDKEAFEDAHERKHAV